jgi:hypothetical protein
MREGADLMAVSHRKQSKVSKSGLSGLDLSASIATPQIGQCFMDCRRMAITSQGHASKPTAEGRAFAAPPKTTRPQTG